MLNLFTCIKKINVNFSKFLQNRSKQKCLNLILIKFKEKRMSVYFVRITHLYAIKISNNNRKI
jgi:hypothetical protein